MAFKRNNNVIDGPGNNFATLNPLVGKTSHANYVYGNLSLEHVSNGECFALSSIKIPKTGKWYVELQMPSNGIFGITKEYITSSGDTGKIFLGINEDGIKYQNGSNTQLGSEKGMGGGSGVAGLLIDPEAETKNLRWFYSGNEVHFEDYDLKSDDFFVLIGKYSGGNNIINFGQDHTFAGTKTDSAGFSPTDGSQGRFYYQPPEGAKALCTANLPSFDGNPQEHFRAVTYVGNGGEQTITTDMAADMLWIKARDNNTRPAIWDSVRGKHNYLCTTDSFAQNTQASSGTEYPGDVEEFLQTGFKLKQSDAGLVNVSGDEVVAWCWKAGGGGGKYNIDGVPFADFTDTGLTDGTIEPTGMSVNTKAGFSIVKWRGNGAPGSTYSHGLTKAPDIIITKAINADIWWNVYYIPEHIHGYLNETAKLSNTGREWFHNDTPPDEDLITNGYDPGHNNGEHDYITYAWHSVPGYSSIGSYTGNGSADGPFVNCGFKPAFVMIKNTTNSNSWVIIDNQRSPFNPSHQAIRADSTGEEITNQETNFGIDVLSNGFKPKTSGNENVNSNNAPSNKYIYMVFAEHSM